MIWTPELDEILRIKNLSASEKALQIGTTKNSVLGRMRRIGLSNPSSKRTKMKSEKKEAKTIEETTFVANDNVIPLLYARHNQCRWPFGDKNEFCCGEDIVLGSYCKKHASISYPNSIYGKRAQKA